MSGLESATTINQLNPLNPSDVLDYVSTGDDHIRLIKQTIQNTFPRVAGAVSVSDADLSNTTYLVGAGTANAITLTFSPVWTAYTAGKGVIFKALAANTAATTVNINGLGAISLRGLSGQVMVGGEIVAGGIYRITYDGTYFRMCSNEGYTNKTTLQITPYTGTSAFVLNSAAGTMTLGTNGNGNIVCNANGSTSVAGALSINGVQNQGFPAGTVIPFFQAAAPPGWTQVTTYTNHMLRVIGTAGGGTGGSDDPTVMSSATMPSHTHAFDTGNMSANATHTHTDSGHAHTGYYAVGGGNIIQGWFQGGSYQNGGVATSTGYASISTTNTQHTHSGTTDPTGSANWTPMYVNMILCSKSA